jgi:hypothetical protein
MLQMIYMCKVEMAACNKQIDADDLNDAIDELSALILTLPAKTTDLDKLKEGILAIKKEANPCGLENNNNGNNNANNNGNNGNNNGNNGNNASNPGPSRSRKRSTRKRKTYRK